MKKGLLHFAFDCITKLSESYIYTNRAFHATAPMKMRIIIFVRMSNKEGSTSDRSKFYRSSYYSLPVSPSCMHE